MSRLKAGPAGLAAELAGKKTELDNRAKEVDAKRVEAMAEAKGVEGTLKERQGPGLPPDHGRYGQAQGVLQDRRGARERCAEAPRYRRSRASPQIERELAGVDGELAKLKGEADTADQRIKAAEYSQLRQGWTQGRSRPWRAVIREGTGRVPPAAGCAETLASLHQYCVQLYNAMISTDATKDRVRNIDCDPKQAREAAAVMFGLNAGLKAYETTCAGGDEGADDGRRRSALLAVRPALPAGLGPAEQGARTWRRSCRFIDLNRDDKAHNFVVSLNAFRTATGWPIWR